MFDIESKVWGHFAYTQQGREQEPIGPSGVHGCHRQQAYAQLGVEPTDPQSTTKADVGSLIHMGIAVILDQWGIDTEVPVHVPMLSRAGRADIVVYEERLLIDIKTFGDRAYQRRVEAGGPYPHQWDQCELYALGLQDQVDDPTPWTLQILAVNRDTGEHTVWEKPQDMDRGRVLARHIADRQAAIDEAKARLADPTSSVSAIQLAEQFPREGDGPGRGMPCDWCPFLSLCWPAPFDDLSPQAATIVDDPDLIAAKAAEYKAAAAEESAAKNRKYAAQAFLKGITGTFGGWVVSQVGGGEDTEVPDVDEMMVLLASHGETIPMVRKPGRRPYPSVRQARR